MRLHFGDDVGDACLQMMQAMANDEGWTVSYNNELRVLYKHARSEWHLVPSACP